MRETDSYVAVLSRTSAILPHNRLARLAHSANGKQGFAKASLRAVGGSSQTGSEGEFPRAPLIGCFTAFCLFQRRNIVNDRERRPASTERIWAQSTRFTIIQHASHGL